MHQMKTLFTHSLLSDQRLLIFLTENTGAYIKFYCFVSRNIHLKTLQRDDANSQMTLPATRSQHGQSAEGIQI